MRSNRLIGITKTVLGASCVTEDRGSLDWKGAAQTIPSTGQVFSYHGFRFEVLARKDNRITRLKIRPLIAA